MAATQTTLKKQFHSPVRQTITTPGIFSQNRGNLYEIRRSKDYECPYEEIISRVSGPFRYTKQTIEDCLSKEEQETIRQVICDDFAYDFGMAEQELDKLYTEIAQSGKEDIYD